MSRFSRRTLMRGCLGGLGASLTLPMLPSLVGEGRAQVASLPRRFIYVSISNGEQPENWWPTHPFSFTERPGMVREADLTVASGTGGLSKVLGPAFDPFLEKMTFLRGLGLIGPHTGGHNPSGPLSGYRDESMNAVTVDQILAQSELVYPEVPAVRSIHLKTKLASQAEKPLSIDGNGNAVLAEASPSAAWQRLFGNFVPDDPAAQKRAELELGVLDRVRDDYDALRSHPRLSREDRERLTAHAELVHDLELRLRASSGANCAPPSMPTDPSMNDDPGLAEVTNLNTQLLTAALACDRTRVAVLQLAVGTDLRWDHHAISHAAKYDPVERQKLADIHRGYGDQLAGLLASLDAVVENPATGETLLDNTLIMFGNEDGVAWDVHEGGASPVLLCGGSSFLDTGRYVDYRQYDMVDGQPQYREFQHPAYGSIGTHMIDGRGRLHNSLLLSVLEAMGETPPTEGIGDYRENIGQQFDETQMRQPLPYLSS